ncbi:hypothetical protein Tco_1032206, partial [Tanacetum coccineum]
MSCKRILAITNAIDRPKFLISMIEYACVHPPAHRPHNPDIGDDETTVCSHVLTTASCNYCADTGVNERSAIMHSRHSNVEHQDIVATVQQVSPQSIVALPDNRHILLPHTTPIASRKTNNKGCCVAHECASVDIGVDDNHSVITYSRRVNAGQEGVATTVQDGITICDQKDISKEKARLAANQVDQTRKKRYAS